MIHPDFVSRKCRLIAEDLAHLLQFKDEPLEGLASDFVKLAAVERLLERIIMRAIDINLHLIGALENRMDEKSTRLTYRDSFLRLADYGVYPEGFALDIAKSAGFRNILLHDYNDVNRTLLHASIQSCLKDYTRYIDYITAFLKQHSS
ncbi:DUF86 domain-containing protein [Desulfococcus sp.]|uniref:type VII toxin-antitoxin system HepT family RNase toxin n=1 Tax=Desulfococcus sp. TaxID=2025834 RepID=UPI003593FBC3